MSVHYFYSCLFETGKLLRHADTPGDECADNLDTPVDSSIVDWRLLAGRGLVEVDADRGEELDDAQVAQLRSESGGSDV